MAKRKAAVNDIIYELDNEDIEISSEDEAKEAKINRLDEKNAENTNTNVSETEEYTSVIEILDTPIKEVEENSSSTKNHNGGKKVAQDSFINLVIDDSRDEKEAADEVDSSKKVNTEGNKSTIFNEDIIIDSPTSTSDLGVVGCENRTPLVTVKFRDKKLASSYKTEVKAFMLRLIKLHEKDNLSDIDCETDIELDIWPEDLNDAVELYVTPEQPVQDNLFFVDTDPCSSRNEVIPAYKEVSSLISNKEEKDPSPLPLRRGPVCFNCDGPHQLRECKLPKNYARIAGKRKNMTTRVGRYHVEDEQKYGHLIPGRISGQLRHALGLKRHELPLHIYRMRLLGYPPGWLEEARISHSGITMFDSTGAAILDPEEEEGEVCEPGCKDKFDIKKILDFPGFNVPASSRYKEEGHQVGAPPLSEHDSKFAMLQALAPNAMKAYKRKKLTLFPSAASANVSQEVAEMELDSGDELGDFPSVPPLPDEAPPTPPPPPQSPPPPPSPSPPPPPPGTASPAQSNPSQDAAPVVDSADETANDIEVLEVMTVADIPVPESESITIDDDDNEKAEQSRGRGSPSLDDLEEKKRKLLDALGGADTTTADIAENDNDEAGETAGDETLEAQAAKSVDDATSEKYDPSIEAKSNGKDVPSETSENEKAAPKTEVPAVSTPESKTGHVKTTLYGTPVINIASPYVKLPTDDKFAKDICDVINFENLPNSTGKYKQISTILKRVKTEVDRIQDS